MVAQLSVVDERQGEMQTRPSSTTRKIELTLRIIAGDQSDLALNDEPLQADAHLAIGKSETS
jgi:hypothetical protein